MGRKVAGFGATQRFLRDHVDFNFNECLLWPFGRDGAGYGRATFPNISTRLAHRIMCEIAHGPAPAPKAVARHLCGKGHLGCVNPTHLAWGDAKDNIADSDRHGTKPYGENVHISVLTPDGVRRIRRMRSSGMSQRAIANEMNVSPGTIQAVIERRTWGHVS